MPGFRFRVTTNGLRNSRFDKHESTICVVGVLFQGNAMSITQYHMIGKLFNREISEILISDNVANVDILFPNNLSELEGLGLLSDLSAINENTTMPPPSLVTFRKNEMTSAAG